MTVIIAKPKNPGRAIKKRLLVDSGAVYSVIDKEVLKKLGIKPHSKRKFISANGEEIEKEIGDYFFIYKEQKGSAPVFLAIEDVSFGSNHLKKP